VFFFNASESEVTPASPILLTDDRKVSSEDEKSTMATSATSTNETLAFNSNEIKIIEITTILLKILRKHVRNHKK
jgi:hypothetical protein